MSNLFEETPGRHDPDVKEGHDCVEWGCLACASCGFEFASLDRLTWCEYGHTRQGGRNLCFLCYSTPAGTSEEYQTQFGKHGDVLRTVCFAANVIRRELELRVPAGHE